MTAPHFSDASRRARLVARHHLGRTASNVLEATRDVVALHSSDPLTPQLAMWARVVGFENEDLDTVLYEDRALWRLHAMRRTLWIVASNEAMLLHAAAGAKVAAAENKRLRGWLEAALPDENIEAWIDGARAKVLGRLAGGRGRRTSELVDEFSLLQTPLKIGSKKHPTTVPAGARMLQVMAMDMEIVRTRPKGSWRGSQYRWDRTDSWFGDQQQVLEPIEDEAEARARLAARYLARFGPVMASDLKWWTGWNVPQTQEALAANNAVEVTLDRKGIGYVLPGHEEPDAPFESGAVTLLPGLDPTPMGWQERRFFLGRHAKSVFDATGNIGPTVWVDGKIIGAWAVRDNGIVAAEILEDVEDDVVDNVMKEAAELTSFLSGTQIVPRFSNMLEKRLRTEEIIPDDEPEQQR